MGHHFSDTLGLNSFDRFERLEGKTGLARQLIGQISIPKQTGDQPLSLFGTYHVVLECTPDEADSFKIKN